MLNDRSIQRLIFLVTIYLAQLPLYSASYFSCRDLSCTITALFSVLFLLSQFIMHNYRSIQRLISLIAIYHAQLPLYSASYFSYCNLSCTITALFSVLFLLLQFIMHNYRSIQHLISLIAIYHAQLPLYSASNFSIQNLTFTIILQFNALLSISSFNSSNPTLS